MTTTASISRKTISSECFDLMHSNWKEVCFSPWHNDHRMLQQLLYRNNHQHRPTLIHRYVRRMCNLSQMFANEEQWDMLRRSLIETNSICLTTKFTSAMVHKILAERQVLRLYIEQSTNVIHAIVKAGRAIVQGLQRRTFATLFASWIAFIGSSYQFFKHIILQSLLPGLLTVDEKLRMIGNVANSAQLRDLAQSVMKKANPSNFPRHVQHILNHLQGVMDSLDSFKEASNVSYGTPGLELQLENAIESTIDERKETIAESTGDFYEIGAAFTEASNVLQVANEDEDLPPLPISPSSPSPVVANSQKINKKRFFSSISQNDLNPAEEESSESKLQVSISSHNFPQNEDSIDNIFAVSTSQKSKKKRKRENQNLAENSNFSSCSDPSQTIDDIDNIFFSFSKVISKSSNAETISNKNQRRISKK